VVVADAESLPFADASFDLLLSGDVVEHLPELDRHLADAARLLRAGGVYLIKTPNRLTAELYYRLRDMYDAYFWHPSMSSPGELAALLDRHGFDTVFLSPSRLTAAQLRKIPLAQLRPLAGQVPLSWLPQQLRPHLEVAAIRRAEQ
jgi:SAM-dependent methyltransferase